MFLQNFLTALPLFCIIAFGYALAFTGLMPAQTGVALSRFSFTVTIPILLFRLMSELPKLSSPNWLIGAAFFGSAILVFLTGWVIGKKVFHLSRDGQTLFAIAGIFSNDVQLGVPIALAILGKEGLPSAAVIFSLNGFLMWMLATIVIELGRSRNPSVCETLVRGIRATIRNPIIIGILAGAVWGFSGFHLPLPVQKSVDMLADSAAPIALFAVGIGLAQYKMTAHLKMTAAITAIKLGLQPLTVLLLCHVIGLNGADTKAACLMACLPVGVTVYIMAQEFHAMQAESANALLITTALTSFTIPLTLALFGLS